MDTAHRARMGRPSELSVVVAQRTVKREGRDVVEDVTASQRIVETLATGGYVEDAAARAGVSKQSIYTWMKRGARVRKQLIRGSIEPDGLDDMDVECLDFLDAVERAEADGKLLLLGLTEQLARGGFVRETITEKRGPATNEHPDGVMLERTVKREVAEPDGPMLRWRLGQRWPAEWGRQRLELTGEGGGPIEVETTAERAHDLGEAARAYLLGREDEANDRPKVEARKRGAKR